MSECYQISERSGPYMQVIMLNLWKTAAVDFMVYNFVFLTICALNLPRCSILHTVHVLHICLSVLKYIDPCSAAFPEEVPLSAKAGEISWLW